MPGCCVKRCGNNSSVRKRDDRGQYITFHQFPSNREQRKTWIEIIRNNGKLGRHGTPWEPNHNSKICSVHFEDKYIERTVHNDRPLTKLLPSAIPTHFPDQQVKIKKRIKHNGDNNEDQVDGILRKTLIAKARKPITPINIRPKPMEKDIHNNMNNIHNLTRPNVIIPHLIKIDSYIKYQESRKKVVGLPVGDSNIKIQIPSVPTNFPLIPVPSINITPPEGIKTENRPVKATLRADNQTPGPSTSAGGGANPFTADAPPPPEPTREDKKVDDEDDACCSSNSFSNNFTSCADLCNPCLPDKRAREIESKFTSAIETLQQINTTLLDFLPHSSLEKLNNIISELNKEKFTISRQLSVVTNQVSGLKRLRPQGSSKQFEFYNYDDTEDDDEVARTLGEYSTIIDSLLGLDATDVDAILMSSDPLPPVSLHDELVQHQQLEIAQDEYNQAIALSESEQGQDYSITQNDIELQVAVDAILDLGSQPSYWEHA